MKASKRFLVGLLLILGLGACTHSTDSSSVAADGTEETQPGQRLAKFAPNDSTVLVFIGQDNEAVGGHDASKAKPAGAQIWDDGYIDHFKEELGMPAGITHYIYMVEEGKLNSFGSSFSDGKNEGLNGVDEWSAGDMCLRCYLDNQQNQFENTIVHLSISMEFDGEDDIAAGKSDDLIRELGDFLEAFSQFPFLIRIGYEFNGAWNGYDPVSYKKAFVRIVDQLDERGIDNYATVMASSSMHIADPVWNAYYPGDRYVDWIGYSFFDADPVNDAPALQFARKHQKPIFIAEATPWKDTQMTKDDGNEIWESWFVPLFNHIEENQDVIKAVSYINTDWQVQDMWKNNDMFDIDTRLQVNDALRAKWVDKMSTPLYLHSTEGTYEKIGF
ncbi:MAG: hypothetical protein KI786_02390 [Mameliella sp.]|nr:hypothetical protein [Phaeodactylibacter sp.]